MDDFGKCKQIAIAISEEIPEATIMYGLYFPMTPKKTWDKRWRAGDGPFTHFWIEYEGRIIDCSKTQFGEPDISIVPKDDVRYVRVGVYHKENDSLFPVVNEPEIRWSTIEHGSCPAVSVIWAGYREHMRKLEALRAS